MEFPPKPWPRPAPHSKVWALPKVRQALTHKPVLCKLDLPSGQGTTFSAELKVMRDDEKAFGWSTGGTAMLERQRLHLNRLSTLDKKL